MSWFPEPGAFWNDAFSLSWSSFQPHLFPPFILIGKVLNKLIQDKVQRAISIIPLWRSQFWFPLVIDLLISIPVRLPRHKDLLVLPHSGTPHLYPEVWILSPCSYQQILASSGNSFGSSHYHPPVMEIGDR